VSGFNHHERQPLEPELTRIEWFGQRDRVGDVTGETRAETVVQRLRGVNFFDTADVYSKLG
jgi:hypothetical protein